MDISTVKDLIDRLQKYDPNLKIAARIRDEDSQNGFGALIRSLYTVELSHNTDNILTVEYVTIVAR